jgi:hypothetical protein
MSSVWIVLAILISCLVCQAHQPKEGTVVGTFGPFLHQTHTIHAANSNYSPPLLGMGLLAEGDLYDRGGIEIGLFYTLKSYLRFVGTSHVHEEVHKLSVPIGYRHWFTNSFSTGLFFESSFSNGDAQSVYNDTTTGDTTAARDVVEYGIEYSLQWEFWNNGAFAVLLDGRYFFSLSPKPGEDSNQYGMMLGVKYIIQEK